MTRLVEVPESDRQGFGSRILTATHHLEFLDLFTDESMAALLDRHRRERVFALTMGEDPEKPEENLFASHDGLSGTALLNAVAHGRLWLNIKDLHQDAVYGELVSALYGELHDQCGNFHPSAVSATLLISSPRAMVYYHVDGPPSLLWHVRGKKRIWVYPALDERLVPRERLEEIMAGAAQEYLPYEQSFDSAATMLDLTPGVLAVWPQNAAHRVTNFDSLNVSLSTEHFTAHSRRRARVYLANRFFRKRVGIAGLKTKETGIAAQAKILVHRAGKALGLDRTVMKRPQPTMRVDPTAPNGCVKLTDSDSRVPPGDHAL